VTCPGCGSAVSDQAKFCAECGTRLASQCPSCGTKAAPTAKFCAECGTSLTPELAAPPVRPEQANAILPTQAAGPGAAPAAATETVSGPVAERRLVSVLFADLVGFTTLSESRDAEEVRELLTRYFDTCTMVIRRYGGTVEKFIGDAVMAVWGAPVANEDDAERAVRAALDLVSAVALLGEESGAAGLAARAGVLTGEAAVTLGAQGQGMIAGDLVNTASRIQSAAPPGGVLVGEATRFASQAAVVYENAGQHNLKGKAEPVPLFRALRVVSMRSGGSRATGLEGPFVGRDHELRTVRDLMHAVADRRSTHLLSITGIAGIGKSRLSWELEKYVDGLVETFWWHRGRCLAYGEGVTFSALADMVRMRALIAEGEDSQTAGTKLAEALAEHVPDETERRWVEPRLRQLLGLPAATTGSQEDLFAAWRLFLERMAGTAPVVLVFEDMQWADSGLLDFIEYVVEWSRDHPIYVVTLARPELLERRSDWAASRRNVSSLYLDPLPDTAMRDLLAGLVPGLPDEVTEQVLARAGGVPLYAVETVRMLLDKGLLAEADGQYLLTGEPGELEVPDTLHALVAARLDGLGAVERRLLGDAAVLGKTFTEPALVAVSGESAEVVQEALDKLRRREILEHARDPRSPERGQLGFVQDLLQLVAYETLSRRDRLDKHLAVAAYLERASGAEGDVIEVVASHYIDALALMPDDEQAAGLKDRARTMLVQAGDRIAALGSWTDARRLYARAVPLADQPGIASEVHERAGRAALAAGDLVAARGHYERAIADLTDVGDGVGVARVTAMLAEVDLGENRMSDAAELLQQALTVLGPEQTVSREVAALSAQLARTLQLAGRPRPEVEPHLERALFGAEALGDSETLSHALNTRSMLLSGEGRWTEGRAILALALDVALAGDHHAAALRAYNNLSVLQIDQADFAGESASVKAALDLARKVGDRLWEGVFYYGRLGALGWTGQWDEAITRGEELITELADRPGAENELLDLVPIYLARGDLAAAERVLGVVNAAGPDERAEGLIGRLARQAQVLRARAELPASVAAAREAWQLVRAGARGLNIATPELFESLLANGKLEELAGVLAELAAEPPGRRLPLPEAHRLRFEGLLAAARGDEPTGLETAALEFRTIGTPFPLAVTLLEYAEWLVEAERTGDAEPLLREAEEIFTRLKATPWLERVTQAERQLAPAAAQ
jgi:class 3 adenylate cyclase/tetratricopeptide (TPR) repeat protein